MALNRVGVKKTVNLPRKFKREKKEDPNSIPRISVDESSRVAAKENFNFQSAL